jgi:hypothetical protein
LSLIFRIGKLRAASASAVVKMSRVAKAMC